MTEYVIPPRDLAAAALLRRYAHDLERGIRRTDSVAGDLKLIAEAMGG